MALGVVSRSQAIQRFVWEKQHVALVLLACALTVFAIVMVLMAMESQGKLLQPEVPPDQERGRRPSAISWPPSYQGKA